jgi:hypothetical protein
MGFQFGHRRFDLTVKFLQSFLTRSAVHDLWQLIGIKSLWFLNSALTEISSIQSAASAAGRFASRPVCTRSNSHTGNVWRHKFKRHFSFFLAFYGGLRDVRGCDTLHNPMLR